MNSCSLDIHAIAINVVRDVFSGLKTVPGVDIMRVEDAIEYSISASIAHQSTASEVIPRCTAESWKDRKFLDRRFDGEGWLISGHLILEGDVVDDIPVLDIHLDNESSFSWLWMPFQDVAVLYHVLGDILTQFPEQDTGVIKGTGLTCG